MIDRRTQVLRGLGMGDGRGLEIGPLHAPVASKTDMDVVYVDLYKAQGLRDYYAAHRDVPLPEIVDVDFALIDENGMKTIADATAEAAPFDWVVACHVIEHVPDLIGWLNDVAQVVVDGGVLTLVVPDRRYTFDARRPPTTVGQMVQAHLDGDTRPSARAVFDHFSQAVTVSAPEVWHHGAPGSQARIHGLDYAQQMVEKSRNDGAYVDCHVWLFTPDEFVEQVRMLASMGLIDFSIRTVVPTQIADIEFFAALTRLPRGIDDATRRELVGTDAPGPVIEEPAGERVILTMLSGRERRLVDLKRKAFTAARRALRRARAR